MRMIVEFKLTIKLPQRQSALGFLDGFPRMIQPASPQMSYWDRVAHEKRFSHPLRLEWVERYLKSAQARMLDYGCGYGRTLAELSEAGYQNLVGVDFSGAMLARAQIAVPTAGLVRNDGHGFPLMNDCVDAVILFAVLTCTPASGEQRSLLAEVKRVLRPGGLLYLSDLLVNNDQRNRERYERDAVKFEPYGVFQLPEGVVVRHHQKEWIDEITNPFEQVEFESFTVTTMNGNASAAFQYLGRKQN
jgi:SAM-dependent methyltransferase